MDWPPQVDQLAQFVAYMSLGGLSSRTAELYLSAISFQCKTSNLQDTTKHFIVTKLIEGFRRTSKAKRLRLPITYSLLESILTKLPAVCRDEYESCLFSAVFALAFFGFFRVGELAVAKQNSVDVSKVVGIQDITFEAEDKALLVLVRFSKTDQLGRGVTLRLGRTNSDICPVRVVKRFLTMRSPVAGPLFCHFNHKPLTRFQFASILQKAIRVVDPTLSGYKSHSFRLGAATRAAQLGWSVEKIKQSGRWSSDAYRSYIWTNRSYRDITGLF